MSSRRPLPPRAPGAAEAAPGVVQASSILTPAAPPEGRCRARCTGADTFVTLDRDGSLAVYRGYVRPEDEPREDATVESGSDGEADALGQGIDVGVGDWQATPASEGGTVITSGGQAIGVELPEDEGRGTEAGA